MSDVKPLASTPARKQPNGVPQTFIVKKLEEPSVTAPRHPGRRAKAKMPPLPKAILDGMSDLEKEHFQFFLDAHHNEYGDSLTQTDEVALVQAAIEYINLLRVQADQLETGKVISMARQHPGVQMRAWLDSLSVTRKQRLAGKPSGEDPATKALQDELLRLSKAD